MDNKEFITLPSFTSILSSGPSDTEFQIIHSESSPSTNSLPSLASLNLPYPCISRRVSVPDNALYHSYNWNYHPNSYSNDRFNSRMASFDETVLSSWQRSSSLPKQNRSENRPKRFRRRPEQVQRFYRCLYHNCDKSYGTLNHLNAHIQMQDHGRKQLPSQYRELRLALRRQRKLYKAQFS